MNNTQRIPFRLKNNSTRSLHFDIKDRLVEVKTTSLGGAPDQLPPMSLLSTFLGDDDIFVITADGIGIEKEEEDNG